MKTSVSLLFFLVLVSVASFTPGPTDTDTVRIDGGLVSGTFSKEGDVQIFRGIPFAAPPIGDLR
ncbi:MAG TPA: carboxylesterase family protein, partial [Fibrella sp.]